MTDKFNYFPVCAACGLGNLALMPRVTLEEPIRAFCVGCQEQVLLTEVRYEKR